MQQLGKYRILEPVASGGMADVFRAEVPGAAGFVKEVALKLIRGDHGESSEFVRMFIQEARLASRLRHANVVQVFEFDEIEGRYYIAMEFVHGRTLRRVVDRCREAGVKLGLSRAVHVCAEVAKALAYAHRVADEGGTTGIVHRDVSPQNILVSFEGEVKLTDFGIARAMGRGGLTEPGTIKGKVAYMAPEQARGGPVDAPADVFSLAVVLWELCAGRRLFARDSEAATLAAVMGRDRISPPSSWNEAVPAELDATIMGALERDPDQRTRSAQELVSALGAVLMKLARSPEDVDLRALMHRLWPEGATPPSARPVEPTAVRTVPAREASASDAAKPHPYGAPWASVGEADPDASTRTALVTGTVGRAPRRPLWRAAAVGIALAVLVGGAMAARYGRLAKGWQAVERAGPSSGEPAKAGKPAGGDLTASTSEAVKPPPPGVPRESLPPAAAAPPIAAPVAVQGPPEPVATAQTPADQGARAPIVLATREGLNTLPLPRAASGDGILSVNASPWGTVFVDGQKVGHTPREVRVPAGRHRLRVVHPTKGAWEKAVVVPAGGRLRKHVEFKPVAPAR